VLHALKRAKCKRIFVEQKSGRNMNRPELVLCLDKLRKGDTLVIWKLDRLGRSLRDLIEIVARLESGVSSSYHSPNTSTRRRPARGVHEIQTAPEEKRLP
jgi:DNA invertase Pin-like site-specific DNA recombinase